MSQLRRNCRIRRTAWQASIAFLAAWPAFAAPLARAGDVKPAKPPTVEDLERDLKAQRPETRRSAVKKLAALNTRESLALVFEALADPDGEVADEAELWVGRVREPKFVAQLFGPAGLSARDEWVQLRAAEAIGRLEVPFDPRPLARLVTPSQPELARTALWSLERAALVKRIAGNTEDLAEKLGGIAAGSCAPDVRGSALLALAPLDAFAAHDRAVEALGARDDELRCAALIVVSSFAEQENLTLSSRALDDASARVRTVAIANLERLKSRPAVLSLIARLEREPRARPKNEILRFLRETSGQDHGLDFAAWRAWAGTLQGPWSTGDVQPVTAPLGETNVALAGLPMLSDRVTFLIDLSGSMWDTQHGTKTRKQLVDDKLRACLEALPGDAQFNVIPYTRAPNAWEKRLVRATRENVARAADWFERCHQHGPGNVFDAAVLALEDPEVDTLVILTDGVPTGGRRWNLGLMVELLVERNRYRQVAFDSILVEAPKGNRKLWADLAARTGGRSIVLETLAEDPAPAPPAKGPTPPAKTKASPPGSGD